MNRLLVTRARKALGIASRPRLWSGLLHGSAAATEHFAVPFAFPHMTVLDVGASRGQFAQVARTRFPNARIVCFEPLAVPRTVLTETMGDRADIFPYALGAQASTKKMHVTKDDDSSSLLAPTMSQIAEFEGSRAAGTAEVIVKPLGEVLTTWMRPCLLKIDVQGYELEVLKGVGPLLHEVDEVYVECSFTELYEGQPDASAVVAFLLKEGLRLRGVYNTYHGRTEQALQADFLFRR